jgi:hypothetical protein
LTVFAYFTAVGLSFFGYRYFEAVATRGHASAAAPFIDEVLTGAWMAALLFPLVARFACRFPIASSTWTTHLPLHVAGSSCNRSRTRRSSGACATCCIRCSGWRRTTTESWSPAIRWSSP